MRKQQVEAAAHEVAEQLRLVEESINMTLIEVAELEARIMRGSQLPIVGFAAAQAPLAKLAEAHQALIRARGHTADCHAELAAGRKNIPAIRSFGDQECPPDKGALVEPMFPETVSFGDQECPPPSGLATQLRVVGE